MKKWIAKLIVNVFVVWGLAYMFSGISFTIAAMGMMAVALWLINSIIRPILKFLTFPINLLSFGLWSVVLNVILLWLAFLYIPGAYFNSLMTLFLASIVLGVLNAITEFIFGDE